MPLPDRPVSGASIESVWGQDIHDRVFAPKGCRVHGAAASNVSTTYAGLDIDTVDDDPGGWLQTDEIEVPTGAEGLYSGMILFRTTTGTDGQVVLCSYSVNGTPTAAIPIDCITGAAPQGSLAFHEVLAAGDTIQAQARKLESGGATPTVQVMKLSVIRIGDDYGA